MKIGKTHALLVMLFPLWALTQIPSTAAGKQVPPPAGLSVKAAAPTQTDPGNKVLTKSERAAAALLIKGKAAYRAGKIKEAETGLAGILKKYGNSPAAEEAAVILTDIRLRQGKARDAQLLINRFQKFYVASEFGPRMLYYEGLAHMQLGMNRDAAQSLAKAINRPASASLFAAGSKAMLHLVESGGLTSDDLRILLERIEYDADIKARIKERLGDELMKQGKYGAAKTVYADWLQRFPSQSGRDEVEKKMKKASSIPTGNRTLLIMGPFSGDFADIGKALGEGARLAVDEANSRGSVKVEYRMLDTQGDPIITINRLRKVLREEKIDGIVGPAMSDVSMAVAIELSSRVSGIPMITPTATTQGIAALGEGLFQLNVTTGALGQKIASFAVHCLGLKDFAILAPKSEYGVQLAEAFRNTVERKGGLVIGTEYYSPDENDFATHFLTLRRLKAKLDLERERIGKGLPAQGASESALRDRAADSLLSLDGLFIAAGNGEEAYKLVSQASYHKIKNTPLGSSGWNDKSILHKNSSAAVGAYFSLDFPENPKTNSWSAFQKTYARRWGRNPDKVAALSYDASRFMVEGILSSAPDKLVETLKEVKSFEGVQGKIFFDGNTGANINTALYSVERKGFKEIQPCPEGE